MDSTGKRMFTLRIDEKPISNNVFYSQGHWSGRSALKNYWHGLVDLELAKYGKDKIKPFEAPFVTIMYAVYKNRGHLPDLDNLAATHKLITDALVNAGVLPGDGPEKLIACIPQVRIDPTAKAPFVLYSIHQLAMGLEGLKDMEKPGLFDTYKTGERLSDFVATI